jgi:hypothetical protein
MSRGNGSTMSNTYKIDNSIQPNTILTSSGSNGTWTTSAGGYAISPAITVDNNPASLNVQGKLIHNGRDLEERLEIIEKVLMIPERDIELEKKYPKLKTLYNEYIKELSKYRNWEKLKGN